LSLPLPALRVLLLLGIDQLADPWWHVPVSPQRIALLSVVDKLGQDTSIKFVMLPVVWISPAIRSLAWRSGAPHEAIDFLPDSGQARSFLFFEELSPFGKL
jgi:hypothetical protein